MTATTDLDYIGTHRAGPQGRRAARADPVARRHARPLLGRRAGATVQVALGRGCAMTGVEERAAAVREVCHRYQRMTGRNPVGLGDIIRILVGPDMAPLMADLLAQPTADEAEGDEREAPDFWRDERGQVWLNLRKFGNNGAPWAGAYDPTPGCTPLWIRALAADTPTPAPEPGVIDRCRHGEPEGACASCAACAACRGECGTCPYAPPATERNREAS